jgi:hypothetical protein
MRDKSLLMSVFALAFVALAFTACGGDDDGATPDAAHVVIPDAMPIVPDAPVANVTAADLGKTCQSAADCSGGMGVCLKTSAQATAGFCSLQCGTGMTGDDNKCNASNGFPGPGTGKCDLVLQDGTTLVCGVECSNAATECPTGLTCTDLFDAMGQPGMDGMKDLCVPPSP